MTEWTGLWNNWIAPFHVCPRCGESLNWEQREDAFDRPLIYSTHCGVSFSATIKWPHDAALRAASPATGEGSR